MSNLAHALGKLEACGEAWSSLWEAVARTSLRRCAVFKPQELANLAWGFAAANQPAGSSQLFDQRFARRCDQLAADFTLEELCQLHQWATWHAGERGRSDSLPSDVLLERCRAAFGSEEGRLSQMQRNVGVALASLGLRPAEEVVLHEGYSLDFVVEWRGERVGVEVDGPSHFVSREHASRRCSSGGSCGTWAGGSCRCRTGSGTRLTRLASEPRSTRRHGWTD